MAKSVHFPSNSLPWRKAIIWKGIVIMRLKKVGQKYLSTISYMITIGSLICISLAPCSFISTHMNLPYSLNCMICHCINENIYQTTTDKYFSCIQFVSVCGVFFYIYFINNAAINNPEHATWSNFESYFTKLDFYFSTELNVLQVCY